MVHLYSFLEANMGLLMGLAFSIIVTAAAVQMIKIYYTTKGNRGYYDLSKQLLEENADLKTEIVKMSEKISSIERMLKEVQ